MKLIALGIFGVTIPLAVMACTYSDGSSRPFIQGPPPTTSAPEVVATSGNGPLTASVAPQGRGTMADRRISDLVRANIMNDPQLAQVPLDRIRIETTKGKVTLAGIVASDAQHKAISDRVKGTAGVTSVDDQIEVLPSI